MINVVELLAWEVSQVTSPVPELYYYMGVIRDRVGKNRGTLSWFVDVNEHKDTRLQNRFLPEHARKYVPPVPIPFAFELHARYNHGQAFAFSSDIQFNHETMEKYFDELSDAELTAFLERHRLRTHV